MKKDNLDRKLEDAKFKIDEKFKKFYEEEIFKTINIKTSNVNYWKKIDTERYLDKEMDFDFSVEITKKGKLIVAPGVKLTFGNQFGLTCYGQLIAEGSMHDPIIFSGDYWRNIRFRNCHDKSILKYCTIEHGTGYIGYLQKKSGSNTSIEDTGGGLAICNSAVHIENSRIENNSARIGGGIAAYQSEIDILNSNISRNNVKLIFSMTSGGGIHMESCTGTLRNNKIEENNLVYENGNGGGIEIIDSMLIMENNIIKKNNAERGGGIYVCHSIIDVHNNTIDNNITSGESNLRNAYYGASCGGGIYMDRSELFGDNNAIINNKASQAGGIFMESSKFLGKNNIVQFNSTYTKEAYNSYISDNSVQRKGGVFMREAEKEYINPSFNDCVEKDNNPR